MMPTGIAGMARMQQNVPVGTFDHDHEFSYTQDVPGGTCSFIRIFARRKPSARGTFYV
jgi:hypothetical protein